MNINNLYGFILAILLTLVPAKIFLSVTSNGFENSYFFIIISVLAFLLLFYLVSNLDTSNKKNFEKLNSSPLLGILSSLVSLCFVWNGVAFLTSAPYYDTHVNYFFIMLFSFLSAASFLFSTVSHFIGKNRFKGFQLVIFAPLVCFMISLTLFLSLAKNHNGYVMASQSFLAMFFVYYIRTFVGSKTKINIIKRLFLFSISSFLASLMSNIAVIFRNFDFSNIDFVTSVVYTVVSIYALVFTFVSFKENQRNVDSSKIQA
ncbi:MAG: hypothetical protein CfP315_0439 [Candidatus Improbicoccus pseudotrichonymphae]|uniref:Uncharacterized protein n=1 Tax=Candidatus Improbicoccus pseudotrichonymphae TaxID=3033792 RepID=A0AA48HY75_9FIRM|nr:MAG: hypothetical protein CfP315_0439 [Candidatus Improbicoccus pseudotrichonymphae]